MGGPLDELIALAEEERLGPMAESARTELAALKTENEKLRQLAVHSGDEGTKFYYKDEWEAEKAENERLRAALENYVAADECAGGQLDGAYCGSADCLKCSARTALSGSPCGLAVSKDAERYADRPLSPQSTRAALKEE